MSKRTSSNDDKFGSSKSKSVRDVPSLFSRDVAIEGTVYCKGDIQIDGHIKGDIKSGSLTIGKDAVIEGNVIADDVNVQGQVIGKIIADKIRLHERAHVEGDVVHNLLTIDFGAFISGHCRNKDAADKSKKFRGTAKHEELASELELDIQKSVLPDAAE